MAEKPWQLHVLQEPGELERQREVVEIQALPARPLKLCECLGKAHEINLVLAVAHPRITEISVHSNHLLAEVGA